MALATSNREERPSVHHRIPRESRAGSDVGGPPDQKLRRLVSVGVTEAPILGLACRVLPVDPDEGGEVREVRQRDLRGGKVLQAVHLDSPWRVIRKGVPDPGLLGAGEHEAAIVAERAGLGQQAP